MPDTAITRENGGGPEFSALAGHRCLDLVNTVTWRLDPQRTRDRLPDDAAALRWLVEFGVGTETEARSLAADSAGALSAGLRTLREHLYAAVIDGDPAGADALLRLDRGWWRRVELDRVGSIWRAREVSFDVRSPALRLGHEAVALLTAETSLIRQCADGACGWIFLDTSPRQNRRWCAANDCGAKNRSRDHYRRQHGRAG